LDPSPIRTGKGMVTEGKESEMKHTVRSRRTHSNRYEGGWDEPKYGCREKCAIWNSNNRRSHVDESVW
jgi:hypothetical protein